jgi:sialidase-1
MFVRSTIYRAGEGGYVMYRIPSVIATARGTVLAFCEGRQSPSGPGNDSGEINLLVKRSTDGGQTFGAQQVVWSDGKNTCGNPCAVVDESTGAIWLLMTHNLGEDRENQIIAGTSRGTRTVWVTSSDDDGINWSKPREITTDVKKPDWAWYATGPGVGIQLKRGKHRGRLVVPCDYISLRGGKGSGNAHVIYSDDHGKTWKLGGEAPARSFNESQIVEQSDGSLMLNMRNARWGKTGEGPHQRGVCISDDGGESFKNLRHDQALVEPICQGSLLRYSWPESGRSRILFSNPASQTNRMAMTIRMSEDEGKTWPTAKLVQSGKSAYSCLVRLPDGLIGLLYETGEKSPYEQLEFVRCNVEWLTQAGQDQRGN